MSKSRNEGGRFSATYTPAMAEWLRENYENKDNATLTREFNEIFGTSKEAKTLCGYANGVLGLKKAKNCRSAVAKENIARWHNIFTKEQDEWIKANYDNYMIKDLTAEFNKHFGANRSALSMGWHINNMLGLRRTNFIKRGTNKKYSQEMIDWVLANYEVYKYNDELQEAFNKHFGVNYTFDSFRYFLTTTIKHKHGVKRDLKNNVRAITKLRDWCAIHSVKPLLSEVVDSQGYTYVKIANCKVQLKHRYVWEQAYGKIPNGMKVTFLDGNPKNFDLDNLALVNTSEHASFINSGYQGDKELAKMYIEYIKLENEIKDLIKKQEN